MKKKIEYGIPIWTRGQNSSWTANIACNIKKGGSVLVKNVLEGRALAQAIRRINGHVKIVQRVLPNKSVRVWYLGKKI